MSEHTCLVCGYSDDAEFYPRDFKICSCCGTEFGYDDRTLSHSELRREWIENGCPWFYASEPKPAGWRPFQQMVEAGFLDALLIMVKPAKAGVQIEEGDSSQVLIARTA